MMNWLWTLAEAVAPASAEALPKATRSLVELPLMSKGLLTTVVGLLGVFLVLGLLFGTIKLMQRIKSKESEE